MRFARYPCNTDHARLLGPDTRGTRNLTVAYSHGMDPEQQLRRLYAAFNSRDVGSLLAATTEDVDWPNAWEGGRLRGRREVEDYWRRQWAQIDPTVEPLSISARADGRLAVNVRQVVRDLEGNVLSEGDVTFTSCVADWWLG